jgi:hypothetical protein
MPVREDVF